MFVDAPIQLVEGSTVNWAFMKSWPPIITVVSLSFATRWAVARIASGIACPSASPETIDHSPCSLAISALIASSSLAQVTAMGTTNNASARNTFVLVMTSP